MGIPDLQAQIDALVARVTALEAKITQIEADGDCFLAHWHADGKRTGPRWT